MNGNPAPPAGLEKLPRRVWTYERDARGLVVAARSLGGWVVRVHRDAHSRWQELRDSISLVARIEYDDFGDETAVHNAEGVVSISRFDTMHRPLAIAQNGSAATRYQYDGLGHLTGRVLPVNQHDTWQYDQYGRLVTRIDAHGHAVRIDYDSEGRMTALTNRVGERLEWRRDIQGRIIEEKLFDGRVQRYEYDVMGRRVKLHLSDGRLVEQRFDPAGRLISRECSDGLTEQFTYDKEGRTIKAWNNHAVVELKRDRFGRIVAEIQNGRSVQYKYDAEGNRIERRLPFDVVGSALTRLFDVRGRLVMLADERGPGQEFSWDHLDRLVERRCADGMKEVFLYDGERRLRQHTIETRYVHLGRAYTYDVSGNLAELKDSRRGTLRYSYDQSNRLREVRRDSTRQEWYDYDGNDALQATHRGPRRVDAGGKAIHDGSRELVYGKDGSVIEIRAGQSIWSLRHDVNGRLVEVVRPDRTVVTYEYDPFGRRTAKNVANERTEFLWEGWTLAAELQDARAEHIYVALDLRPLAQWHRGERLTPTLDHRAAVQEVFDQTGRLRWACVMDTYGNVLSREGAAASPFRLRGQYEDTETGLYYNFHRHYDPVLADYTAPDPIGLAGGYHFYAYPRNPLRWDDPFGLECVKDEEGNPIPKDDPDHPKDGTGAPAVATEPEPPPPGVPEDEAKPPGQMSDEELRAAISDNPKDSDPNSLANQLRYERYARECGEEGRTPLPPDEWFGSSRGGRPGNEDHQNDVSRNNGPPNNLDPNTQVGDRVPDGTGQQGQAVTIRDRPIDPGPDGRVVTESERFGAGGNMDAEGRRQVRDMRAADPNATIVVTDPARPDADPVVYPPGTQPPPVVPGQPIQPGAPTHVDMDGNPVPTPPLPPQQT